MAIPPFQSMMLPLLEILDDGQEHVVSELRSRVAQHFQLSDEEKDALLPSGGQTFVANRVGWALSHFKVAGIVQSPQPKTYRITERGQQVKQQNPQGVNLKVLDQFPEHVAFHTPKKVSALPLGTEASSAIPDDASTPEEAIGLAYQELRASLAQELLEKIKLSSPAFFERLVVDVLKAMGYGGSHLNASEITGKSGDGGIDGVIRQDRLGLDVIYIQAKRWEGVVGRPVIQSFVGAIHGKQASKGVLITTSSFSEDALKYVKTIPIRIVLVDGKALAELMIDYNVAVSRSFLYEIKKVDNDYFSEL